jgi:hypothetical protein
MNKTYDFFELDEKAQQRVIAYFREGVPTENDNIYLKEYFTEHLEKNGYPNADVKFVLNGNSGDGVAWTGYVTGSSLKELRDILFPVGHKVRRIIKSQEAFNQLCISINDTGFETHDYDTMEVEFDWYTYYPTQAQEWAIKEFKKAVITDIERESVYLLNEGYNFIERWTSDDYIADTLADGNEYYKDGSIITGNGVENISDEEEEEEEDSVKEGWIDSIQKQYNNPNLGWQDV